MEAPLPYPKIRNVFSPRQLQLTDVPSVDFNISDPATALTETNRLRLIRARKIAPALLGERLIPVAPVKNPLYGISYHRIRLHNPADVSRVVELFVRDTDLYFAGFHRGVVAISSDGDAQGEPEWGTLFIFDDLYEEVPPFLHAVKMGISSSHTDKGDAPGPEAMMTLFETLFSFQDDVRMGHDSNGNPQAIVPRNVREAMKTAVARVIIVFCEALRLQSICTTVKGALESFDFARPLPDRSWKLIRWWGQLCDEIQTMRKDHRMALDTVMSRRDFMRVGISTLDHLIGQNGELALCKLHKKVVITRQDMSRLQNEIAALNFADPTFRE